MNQDYIIPDNWSVIEEGFDAARVESSESLFSIGNGAMGQRANFEEQYSGETFQGSYIAGVYYPDKTRVGWWKNGYPEYFAKVLNAPSWIGINVSINGEQLDLHTCKKVENFRRELNMKEGWLSRSFTATLQNNIQVEVNSKRFLSLELDEVGAIKYSVKPVNNNATITFQPYLSSAITNKDTNWSDKFWDTLQVSHENELAFIQAKTMKTEFHTCTFMQSQLYVNDNKIAVNSDAQKSENLVSFSYMQDVKKGDIFSIHKFGGYTVDRNHDKNELIAAAKKALKTATDLGFNGLLRTAKEILGKHLGNGRHCYSR